MQKLLFLCFFLLFVSSLKAGDLPKLNLEIGKKYTIETIYHQDTSKTNPRRVFDKKIYEFIPTGFNQQEGNYDIRLTINYYLHVIQGIYLKGKWVEEEVYETGFVTTYRKPLVYLNLYLVPVKFKLSKESKITSFDFSEYNKIKTPEGLQLEMVEGDQKSIQGEIRDLFFDTGQTTISDLNDHKRSKYHIISEDEFRVKVEVDTVEIALSPLNKPKSIDFVNFLFNREQYQRNIFIDKTTGLILEDKLSFVWNFRNKKNITRYQKLIPIYSENF